jgi:nitric oxide reductase large subunit
MSAPLASDNGNNHSGLVVVITAIYLVLVLASVIARFSAYQRRTIQHKDYLFSGIVGSHHLLFTLFNLP